MSYSLVKLMFFWGPYGSNCQLNVNGTVKSIYLKGSGIFSQSHLMLFQDACRKWRKRQEAVIGKVFKFPASSWCSICGSREKGGKKHQFVRKLPFAEKLLLAQMMRSCTHIFCAPCFKKWIDKTKPNVHCLDLSLGHE